MAKQEQSRMKPVKKEAPQAEKQIRPAEETTVTGEAQARKAMLEREIRRYVKRTGGFRANLHKEDKQEGRRLIEEWNQTYHTNRQLEDGWDLIHVKGYDNVDHFQNMRHVKPRFEK